MSEKALFETEFVQNRFVAVILSGFKSSSGAVVVIVEARC